MSFADPGKHVHSCIYQDDIIYIIGLDITQPVMCEYLILPEHVQLLKPGLLRLGIQGNLLYPLNIHLIIIQNALCMIILHYSLCAPSLFA